MQKKTDMSAIFAVIVIPIALVISILIYIFILGDPHNFIDNNPENNPRQGNILGIIHKGGIIVPILMTMLITVITFSLERLFTIFKARGRGNVSSFVKRIQYLDSAGEISGAEAECDKQKGSVANVAKAGLKKYREMQKDTSMVKDQKILAIQKDVEESTALELPMLQKNLPIIATIAPIGTLMGLFGTVLGMIRAFAALAATGAPDASALSTGISEALINTAFGIGTSALAIIMYNVFTTRIDELTYAIDEAGYSLSQTFAEKN